MLNLTQRTPTKSEIEAGVIEPINKVKVQELLTFFSIPTRLQMEERAHELAMLAKEQGANKAMIGGAPYFMAPLEVALLAVGIKPYHPFLNKGKDGAGRVYDGFVESGLNVESIE